MMLFMRHNKSKLRTVFNKSLNPSNQKPLFPLFLFLLIFIIFTGLFISSPAVFADPYPPCWDSVTYPDAIHWSPVPWPDEGSWVSYTHHEDPIKDKRTQDPSNGGRMPQNYANISSSCTDQSQPSVAWYFDNTSPYWAPEPTFFFRWKVEQIANSYATGPAPTAYQNVDPWKEAQWTVLMDIDGDGFYDFAVNIDGQSGKPSEPVDVLQSLYNTTRSQSTDWQDIPGVYRLFHNPTGFVDCGGTDFILNFRNSLNPVADWPNGSAETVWDYGTTRATDITTPTCIEYNIDYQIPLAMLDASSVGGPTMTADTPFCMTFVTANSNEDPLQKDVAFDGTYTFDVNDCIPCGDLVTLNGGIIPQPVVDWVTAEGCGPTTLTAQVRDAIDPGCLDTLVSVDFYFCYDENADGDDDDCTWSSIGGGSVDSDNPSLWTASWDTTGLMNGQYLVGVRAEDDQGNVTWSYLNEGEQPGGEYVNPSPDPGVVFDKYINDCGEYVSITKTVNPSYVPQGNTVQFTITVTNETSAPLTVNSISDILPSNFTYENSEAGSLSASCSTGSPLGSTGTITWTCAPSVSIGTGASADLTFTADTDSVVEGTYTNVSTANTTEFGVITSDPVDIGVGLPTLTISKTASVYSVEVGDTVTYTITYSNDSPVNTTGVTITDPLPAGLTFVAASAGGSYNSGTRTITWDIGSLASTEGPYTVSFSATVNQSATTKTVNTATIDSNETSPANASASIYVNSPLQLNKSANKLLVDPTASAPDNQVIYTIAYQNTGTSNLTGATITDAIPAGFSYVSHTDDAVFTGTLTEIIGDGYGDDDGTCEAGEPCVVTWEALPNPPGTLAAGVSGSLTLTVQADFPYTGDNYVLNTATIDTNEAPSVFDNVLVGVLESGGVCESYFFHADTEDVGYDGIQKITDTVSPLPSETGSSVTVLAPSKTQPFLEALSFYNPPATSDQTISDLINTSIYIDRVNGPGITIRGEVFDYDPVTGTRTLLGSYDQDFNGNQRGLHAFSITPTGGTLYTGHRILWVFSVRSKTTTQVQLQLQYDGTVANLLSGDTPDTFANSHARLCTADATLVFSKTVDKQSASPDDSLQYTLDFANIGADNATGTEIVDILPTGTTFVSATLNGSSATPSSISGQQYTFDVNTSDTSTVGQLTGGESGVLIINVTIDNPLPDPGINSLTNIAELTTNETDPVSDAVTTNIGLSSVPDITIIKSADKTLLIPGDTVTYTLTVINTGSANATGVDVDDTIAEETYFNYVAGSITGTGADDSSEPDLTWDIGTMAPGQTEILSYQVAVSASGVPTGITTKDNTATADEDTTGSYTSNTVTVTITTNAILEILKSVSSPGQTTDSVGTGDGSTTIFNATLSDIPVSRESLAILVDGTEVGSDSGTGYVIGDNLANSTINYSTGALYLEFITAPDSGDAITAQYHESISAGDSIEYTITVNSIGGSTATGVLVNDPIPSYTSYDNGTLVYQGSSQTDEIDADDSYFDAGNNRVVFDVGDLTATSTRTMTFSVIVDSSLPDGTNALTNTATVSAGNTASKNATATIDSPASPDLSLAKTAPDILPYPLTTLNGNHLGVTVLNVFNVQYFGIGDVVKIGSYYVYVTAVNPATNQVTVDQPVIAGSGTAVQPTIKFILTYSNTGGADASGVEVRDQLASGLLYVDAIPPVPARTFSSPGCSSAGQLVTCTVGTVPAGDLGTLTIYAVPTGTGTYNNLGQMPSNELATVNSNTTTTVVGGIELSKSTSTPTVVNNPADGPDIARYTITVTPQVAQVVFPLTVTDTLPEGFTYNGNLVYGPGATCINPPTVGDTQPTWTNCLIPIGTTLTISFDALLAPTVSAGTYQNPVTATDNSATPLQVLLFDELVTTAEDVTVTIPSDIKVTKAVQSLSSPCTPPTCQVTYLITATNVGSGVENNISITDILPGPQLVYFSDIPSPPSSYNSGTGVWTIPTLNPATVATLQLTALVTNFSAEIRNCASLTASTPADTNSGNDTGCADIIPTIVTLSDFRAYEDSGQVVVQWATSSENDTAGFYLLRLDGSTGEYIRINDQLLPGLLTSPQGGTYSLVDLGASPYNNLTYILMEVEAKGRENAYGPFTVQVGGGNAIENQTGPQGSEDKLLNTCSSHECGMKQRPVSSIKKSFDSKGIATFTNRSNGKIRQRSGRDRYANYTRTAHVSAAKQARIEEFKKKRRETRERQAKQSGTMAKVTVTDDGLYYMDTSTIAGLLGLSDSYVERLIRLRRLTIRNQGSDVAYLPTADNSGLYFYGEKIDSLYTNDNIYWIMLDRGSHVKTLGGRGPDPVEAGTFIETLHLEDDNHVITNAYMDPEEDYWFWDYIVSGYASLDTKAFPFEAHGLADTQFTATLTLYLQGFTDTTANPDHHAVIELNGTRLGEDRWDGTEARTIVLPFDQALLQEGENSLVVKGLLDTGAPYSMFYIDSFDLTYERLYRAHDNKLFCEGQANQVITVEGFTDSDILVLDVTDPNMPKLVASTTIDGTAGNYRASFVPSSPDTPYLALSTGAAVTGPDAWADTASNLMGETNSADYLVIVPEELADAAQSLAEYRQSQGLETKVVLLEDIMDEFNNGIYSPLAIRDFLTYTHQSWSGPPKYVVLIGEGTYDYKDNMGYGDNIMPTIIVHTPLGLFASDNRFADINGDSVPDMAIGRIPVLTPGELQDVLSKIISYEGSARDRVLFASDNVDAGGDFPADSDDLSALVPSQYVLSKVYLSDYAIQDARQLLIAEMNNGVFLVNYMGHAGVDRLAQEGLLRVSDLDLLTNWDRLPILTAMTCIVGQFAIPNYDSLSEALVLKGDGGAVAVWAPSGLSYNFNSKILGREFLTSAFGDGGGVIGDAMLKAFQGYKAQEGPSYVIDIYNLLGDPALKMR